jgi:paraquat-inducible protein B
MTMGKQALVGAFVLGGLVLAVGALLLFGNLALFNSTERAVVVFQDSIAGLSVGSPVTFRGVNVGSVERIGIDFNAKSNIAYIPVTVRLEPQRGNSAQGGQPEVDLPNLIKRGLRAQLNIQSFVTGQAEIDLDFDPKTPATQYPGISSLPQIPTEPSTIQRAKEQLSQLPLHELAANANVTLQSLRSLTESLSKSLPPLVASLQKTSDQSAQAVGSVAQSVAELQKRLDTTLDRIDRLATDGDQQLNGRGADLRRLLASSDETMRQVKTVLANLQGMVSPRSDVRLNLESALRDLAASAASLRGFAGEVERNPQLLLTGRAR